MEGLQSAPRSPRVADMLFIRQGSLGSVPLAQGMAVATARQRIQNESFMMTRWVLEGFLKSARTKVGGKREGAVHVGSWG